MTVERHELSITRLIDAPVATVWRAWTEHFADWWCPRPWTTEVTEMDLRGGGRCAIVMRGPAGEANAIDGVFLEVAPQSRIVMTNAFLPGWIPQAPFMVRLDDFAEEDGGTRLTATARHWDAQTKANHEAMGFGVGWNAAFDQLEEVVRRLA